MQTILQAAIAEPAQAAMAATLRALADAIENDHAYRAVEPGIELDLELCQQPERARAIVASLKRPTVHDWTGESGTGYRDITGDLFGVATLVRTELRDGISVGGCAVGRQSHQPGGSTALTAREKQVLDLLAGGLSNPEIGKKLWLSRRTVQTHVEHIMAKTGARNRVQAAVMAIQGTVR